MATLASSPVFLDEAPRADLQHRRTSFHRMPHGAEIQENGQVRFTLWAPDTEQVHLLITETETRLPMEKQAGGVHLLVTSAAHAGSKYKFVVADGLTVPDPASRFQPEDVHGPSEVIDPASYTWKDHDWRGRPWAEAVVYELHMGAFTPEGTFRAAIGKLRHLVDLGVNTVEVMPVADFPGTRNWGYDGVLLYAPDSSYGRPEDFKAFVDAAHAEGISVILDVVYNHFGPDGNYMAGFAPQLFTKKHKTPWGDAVNYDDQGSDFVREFVIHNALYWIEEFHLDGLRLDAVHAIQDDSPRHLLDELAQRVRTAARYPVHLVLENEDNESCRLSRGPDGQPKAFTAQWNDDMHHVLHTAATLETNGYYRDYTNDAQKLGRALAEGFAFQGQVMECRDTPRGEPSAQLSPDAFVAFMQNHDQIGNRAFGERINAIASPEAVHAIAAVYLLLPQIPMLFMGEEWGSSQPFPFFCDFHGELAELVRKGRREEFAHFPEFQDPEKRERIPDPQAEETFQAAKLDWKEAEAGVHAEWLGWYKHLLKIRHDRVGPLMAQIGGHAGTFRVIGTGAVFVTWRIQDGQQLALAANLSDKTNQGFPPVDGETLWQEGAEPDGTQMRPWTVRWSICAA